MDLVLENLLWAKKYYAAQVKAMEKELEKLPKGRLFRKKRNRHTYYYHWHDGKQHFIKKEDSTLIEGLARAYYDEKNLQFYETNYNAICDCIGLYQQILPETALQNLPKGYDQLPTDYFFAPFTTLTNQAPFREDGKVHVTSKGIVVRSKSEAILIGLLEKHHIRFEYEPAVWIDGDLFHPDLKLYRPRDAKEIFHEHFGRMDDSNYRVNAVNKILKYASAGITLWDNLIITFDGEDGTIDVVQVEKILQSFVL